MVAHIQVTTLATVNFLCPLSSNATYATCEWTLTRVKEPTRDNLNPQKGRGPIRKEERI